MTTSPEPSPDRDRHDQADDFSVASGKVISVAVIDDNRLVREGIVDLLGRVPDIRMAASDARGYATLLDEFGPDVVLLDLGLVDPESLVIVRALRRDHQEARVILMDLLPAHEDLVEFIEAGVRGFILKDANLSQVLRTIRLVAGGLDVLPDLLAGALFSEIAREASTAGDGQDCESVRLSDQEREVLDLIAQGSSIKDIARRLDLPLYTVRSHLRNTMEKFTLHSRLEFTDCVYTRSDAFQTNGQSH